ncbi:MAG: helix-turn-helix domain-containing protein [Candidatus Hydrogenedentes bacterium]|nr:helix-turn-helix domain-containing protein [Candidatus Hydrogenedentota bacterium]
MGSLLTIATVAARLSVDRGTVYRWAKNRACKFPVVRFPNGRMKVDADDLQDWLNRCKGVVNPQRGTSVEQAMALAGDEVGRMLEMEGRIEEAIGGRRRGPLSDC